MVYISEIPLTSTPSSKTTPTDTTSHLTTTPTVTCTPSTSSLPVFSSKHPPCRVCNGKGDGIHFGVNTCSACKSFFCRRMKKFTRERCHYAESCPVGKIKRCPACRLARCRAVGMSEAAIKIGRTSYVQVTAAVEEVKQLELQLKMKQDGSVITPEEHLAQMDDIIHRLQSTHIRYNSHTDRFYRTVINNEQLYIEHLKLEEHLYGKRKLLTRTEYNEIYSITSIDVDGRREAMKLLQPIMGETFNMMLHFTQSVPGFSRLSKNDQRNLMRNGLFDAVGFLYLGQFNPDHGLYVCPIDPTIVISIEHMIGYGDEPSAVCQKTNEIVRKAQELELTPEEQVVVAGLCLLTANADLSPVGRKIVSANAEMLTELLYQMLDKNHDPEEHTFAKIMSLMAGTKELLMLQKDYHRNMLMDMKDMQIPKEWWDLMI